MTSVLYSNTNKKFYEFLVNELPVVYWVNYMSLGDIFSYLLWYEQSLDRVVFQLFVFLEQQIRDYFRNIFNYK